MQHPSRDGRGRGNFQGGGGGGFPAFPGFPPFPGFPAFPEFPDPFGGMGARAGGFMSDAFGNDPFFSDPFFTRPFGGGSMFGGPGGVFGSGLFGPSLFPQPLGAGRQRVIPIEQRPFNPPHEEHRRGVQIEELSDDHEDGGVHGRHSDQEPIVEHPEEEEEETTSGAELVHYQRDAPAHESRSPNLHPDTRVNNPHGRGYSYQSSSVTYGGVNGPYYAAHSSVKVGADGVFEEQHQEKDVTSGKESHKVVRGLGDKGRAVSRKRNAEGREERFEALHNLNQDELEDFDKTWDARAQRSFPGHLSSSQRLGPSSSSRSRAALPTNGGNAPSIQEYHET